MRKHASPAARARSASVPGRPRDAAADARILEAALALMARHGYARMSLDQVAAEAGVTKPTIYRRYPGKEALAVAALAAYRERDRPAPTGDVRADLVAELDHFRRGVSRPYGMAMIGSVLAEEHDTPALLAGFREHVVRPRRAALRTALERARAEGALAPGLDPELAAHMLVGAYYAQYLDGTPIPADWAARAAAAVLRAAP